jgi:integrase
MARKWLPDNVTAYKDRHGKTRYRWRKRGMPTYHFKAAPGTESFRAELAAAIGSEAIRSRAAPYSYDALIESFYRSSRWQKMKASSQATYRGIIERFRAKNGDKDVRSITAAAIDKKLGDMVKATPAAAANLRKALNRLHNHAVKMDWRRDNPVSATDPIPQQGEGWHCWTDAEITAFDTRWPNGTKERLAKELLQFTALRKSDVLAIGPGHRKSDKLHLRHTKNDSDTIIPMVPSLIAAIDACPSGHMTYLVTQYGKPYTPTGFYNWFKRACEKAGLGHCSPHGLRKAVSRQMAEAGVTTLQGRAVTGHKTDKEFLHYAAAADREHLAEQAVANLSQHLANRKKRNVD